MEVEQKTAGGEKDVECGALCFEPMDGVKDHESLEPIWSELDVFGSGVFNELLSSDVHDAGGIDEMGVREHGHMPGTVDFDLLKVKEEFAQQGGPETLHNQIDAQAANLDGVVNLHDYLAIRDMSMPQNTIEAPYGLAQPDSHGNLTFHDRSFQTKAEVVGDGLEKIPVGIQNAMGKAECGVQRLEQGSSQANPSEESVSHEEQLRLSVINSSERTVNAYELHVAQSSAKEKQEGSERMETEMLGVVNCESHKTVAQDDGETVSHEEQLRLSVINSSERTVNAYELHVAQSSAKEKQEGSERMETEMLGVVNCESHEIVAEDDGETVSHEEQLRLSVINSSERTVNAYELHVAQSSAKEKQEGSERMETEMLGVVNCESHKIVAEDDGETVSHEEQLRLSVISSSERTVNAYELHVAQSSAKEKQEGSERMETEMLGVVNCESHKIVAEDDGETVSHEEELNLSVINSSERTVNAHELHVAQSSAMEKQEGSQRMETEMLGVVNCESHKTVAENDGETGAGGNAGSIGCLVGQDADWVDSDAGVIEVNKMKAEEDNQEESEAEGSELNDEEVIYDRALTTADVQQPKTTPGFVSAMLRDGSLSAEGLASKGFVFIDDDESDSDEDSADSSDDEEDEESDEVSSIADSDGEDAKGSKSRVKTKKKEEAEDAGPPRTKHELDVLPPVPKVTVVLASHHKPVSVGHISSVLDLRVIVESSGSEKILNENSILWLTDPRVPLGIVDEVFGPVKNPFYIVRFNDLSEIPEDAKAGADVSYVSEFSEFVLKDNPSLYKKAVDASGLDDEEVGSEEDLEFSDDEKEAAARMREKSKRALDNRESRQGQDWKSADCQHSKGQRTERGRGRGRSGGRGAATANAVDSAADFVAGMDLQGSPWNATRSASKQSGRRWNRGRQSSPRNNGHQELQTRGSRTGPADGQMSSPQHQQSSQRRDGHYFHEQANSQMHAQQVRQAGGMQGIPVNAGATPVHLQGQRRDGLYFAEQGNSQMHSLRQVGGMQGIPFNAGAMPAHLQGVPGQQPSTGFQAYGYQQAPVYDTQFGIPRQGNIYPVPGGPQLIQNPMVFGNPSLPNPYFNNQGQAQMNMIHNQGYGNIVHGGRLNFGVPAHGSTGDVQVGFHPSLTNLMAPSSMLGSAAVARDPRARFTPINNQNYGLSGGSIGSNNGQRGHSSGRQRRSYPHNKGSRGN